MTGRIRRVAVSAGLGTTLVLLAFPGGVAGSEPVAGNGFPDVPTAMFRDVDQDVVELGRKLFFDPILSGNRNIACASCHHPQFGTSDGVSLSIGEGGVGLGPKRVAGKGGNRPEQRIGRNSPALFNLGATEFQVLFHDGRLEITEKADVRTPLEEDMALGFDSILSAQAMFPVLSGDEMAGHYSENEVSTAVRQGLLSSAGGAWDKISERVRAIPGYAAAFRVAVQEISVPEDIGFTDIANAIAAFVAFEFRADNSPFDRFLRGQDVLSESQRRGMELFYGKAGCSTCHSGLFQTDHKFHAIAMPQFGPGKAARFEAHQRDTGRMRVTGDPQDKFRFRTPSLRNVALTAPYGHTGAYATLEAVIRHHLDPVASLKAYDRAQATLADFPEADDWAILDDKDEIDAIAAANELAPLQLDENEIQDLVAFLSALTDPISGEGRLGVPRHVPSGLPVERP